MPPCFTSNESVLSYFSCILDLMKIQVRKYQYSLTPLVFLCFQCLSNPGTISLCTYYISNFIFSYVLMTIRILTLCPQIFITKRLKSNPIPRYSLNRALNVHPSKFAPHPLKLKVEPRKHSNI